jgi:hypothetical protein
MPAGLEIYGESGFLQLSSDLLNIFHDRTINFSSLPWRTAWNYGVNVSNPYVRMAPLSIAADEFVAIRSTSHKVATLFLGGSAPVGGLQLVCNAASNAAVPTGAAYVCKNKPISSSGFFDVYDGFGNLTFSLNSSILRIKSIVNVPELVPASSLSGVWGGTNLGHLSATDAVILCRPRWGRGRFSASPGSGGDAVSDGVYFDGTNHYVHPTVFMGFDAASPYAMQYSPEYSGGGYFASGFNRGQAATALLVDVSNF